MVQVLLLDPGCSVLAGILRGAGWQLIALGLNLGIYWGVGLPLAILAGLVWQWGVLGLWAALAIATTVQVLKG